MLKVNIAFVLDDRITKFANLFDTCSVRKEIAKTFCNCLLGNDSRGTKTLETSITRNIASGKICFPSWKAYVIQLAEPYCIGHIEGDEFCIQWLSKILNNNICLWNTRSKNIVHKFSPLSKSSKELYLLQHPITNLHSHFKPLVSVPIDQMCLQTSTSLIENILPLPTKKHRKKMKNLAREYHNEKNKRIRLEPFAETQNMVYSTKQQHTVLNKQQTKYQQLDLDKGFCTICTNYEPLQKTFQCCNVDFHAKNLQLLKKKKFVQREKLNVKDKCKLKKQTKQYLDTRNSFNIRPYTHVSFANACISKPIYV